MTARLWDYIDVCNEGDVDAMWLTEADHLAALERVRVEAEQVTTVSVGAAVMAAISECVVEVFRVDSFTDIAGHFLKDRDEVEEAIRGVYRKWETSLPDLAEHDRRVRVETLREVKTAVMHLPVVGRLAGTDSTLAAVHVLDDIDRLINAATTGDTDD